MRETADEWEGFDTASVVYDDRKEKKYQRTVWLVLNVIAGAILISLVWHHIGDLRLIGSANMIEARYEEHGAQKTAEYMDENGRVHKYAVGDYAAHDGDRICLYYREDIRKAAPVSSGGWWIFQYLFFGAVFGVSLWRLIRIYHPKSHR